MPHVDIDEDLLCYVDLRERSPVEVLIGIKRVSVVEDRKLVVKDQPIKKRTDRVNVFRQQISCRRRITCAGSSAKEEFASTENHRVHDWAAKRSDLMPIGRLLYRELHAIRPSIWAPWYSRETASYNLWALAAVRKSVLMLPRSDSRSCGPRRFGH